MLLFECLFIFKNVDELEWHLAADHYKCYSYQCEQCYLSRRPSLFPTQAGVREHLIQDHGLQDHYFRYLFSTEIDRQREQIRQDLDRCLKSNGQKLDGSYTNLRVLCASEVQTQQVLQNKENTKHTVQLREKVPDLPPDIAVIKVEPEDVEMITSENSKTMQLEEELQNEMPATRSQSADRSNLE
uniref:Uncharacterized protein n=1 Tax=Ditylenchus dipsaci TaxID=166011 RepID=A0A915DM49_9BILA